LPRPRVAMRKIRDIIRLSFGEGLSRRQVSASLNVPFTTVSDHVLRASSRSRPKNSILDIDVAYVDVTYVPASLVPNIADSANISPTELGGALEVGVAKVFNGNCPAAGLK
jgi:hypothetical protein